MNASRRAARKYQVRTVTETKARTEFAGRGKKAAKLALTRLMDNVHNFLCNAHHRVIAKQAIKLGIVQQSPKSLHHRRTGIATR